MVITDAHEGANEMEKLVGNSRRMVFFGGAGVSCASGIPDFRGESGLYKQHFDYPPEYMLSHEFYENHPEEFFRFYKDRMLFLDAEPNQAHVTLAELEKNGPLTAVVTQNIDGLHQKAGSKNVLELHGSVHRNYCESCHTCYDAEWVKSQPGVPHCEKCGGRVKPDVVLYGEALDDDIMRRSVEEIARADLLVIGGTSLAVYPAAGLIRYFNGDKIVIVNLEPTPQDNIADVVIAADIAKVFDF
jgi:NAD-dependent deacetylase